MNKSGMKFSVVLVCAVAAACGGGDDNKNTPNQAAGTSGNGGSKSNASAGASTGGGSKSNASAGAGGSKSVAGEGAVPVAGSSAGTAGLANVAGQPDTAAGGEGGGAAEPQATPFTSKPAGVELVLDDAAKAAGFTLVSSNFTQKPSGSSFYKEWWAEVLNGTAQPQCFIHLKADFQDGAGASLQKLDTYAYGSTFDIGSSVGLTATCAAPGEVVPIWSNALDANMLTLDSIKKLNVTLVASEKQGAVVHPSAPTLANFAKTFDQLLAWWNFSGDATATADIYNVKLETWGKSAGVIVGKSAAFHLDNLLKNTVWKFKTDAGIAASTLDSTHSYFSFIDGLDTALYVHYDAETAKLAAVKQAAADSWQAAEARKPQAP